MPESKDPKIRVWSRLRRLYLRRRKRARERREHDLGTGNVRGARKALRVMRRYTDKAQVALRNIRNARKASQQDGKVIVLGFANRPGHPMTSLVMSFLKAVAEELDGTVTVNCGTNHSRYTTSGSVSDHWSGNAGDCGISWNNGDKLAAAALRVCGWGTGNAAATARGGGLHNVSWKGHRVQVIWKTYIGGNHYNHVHLGIR